MQHLYAGPDAEHEVQLGIDTLRETPPKHTPHRSGGVAGDEHRGDGACTSSLHWRLRCESIALGWRTRWHVGVLGVGLGVSAGTSPLGGAGAFGTDPLRMHIVAAGAAPPSSHRCWAGHSRGVDPHHLPRPLCMHSFTPRDTPSPTSTPAMRWQQLRIHLEQPHPLWPHPPQPPSPTTSPGMNGGWGCGILGDKWHSWFVGAFSL